MAEAMVRSKIFSIISNCKNDEGVDIWREEDIKAGIQNLAPETWGYIKHDQDTYREEDQQKDAKHVAGERKKDHWHCVVTFSSKIALSKVAKAFGVPENLVEKGHSIRSKKNLFLYLTHALDEDKHQYPDETVVCNFDYKKQKEKWLSELSKNDVDVIVNSIFQSAHNGKMLRRSDVIKMTSYSFYNKNKRRIDVALQDALKDAPVPPLRLNFFIEGSAGQGKSVLSRLLAKSIAPVGYETDDEIYYEVSGDIRNAFEGYDGQPIIIWDDKRASDLISAFGRTNVLNLFDTHPSGRSSKQNIKYGTTYLVNSINIINGIESYSEFLDALAGEYTDARGQEHEAEDKDQTYRRFPIIICLHERDFDVLLNKGYFEDTRDYQQYYGYKRIVGNFATLKRSGLPPDLLASTEKKMIAPVVEVKERVEKKEKAREEEAKKKGASVDVSHFGEEKEIEKFGFEPRPYSINDYGDYVSEDVPF